MMPRTWKVSKQSNGVHVGFTINKYTQWFFSQNPVDFEKYVGLMMDEVKFRDMLPDEQIPAYELFLEEDDD